jgi:uncharacterized OsmC-like protein
MFVMAEQIRITGVWKNDGSYHLLDDSGNPQAGNMNPAEILTAAVVGCTGKTMHALMNKMKISHDGFAITGLARKTVEKPVRIHSVSVDVSLHGAGLSDAQRARLLELTEKYCLVAQTLKRGADVTLTFDAL